jgi:hypothetical protein
MGTKQITSIQAELPTFSIQTGGAAIAASLIHPETDQAVTAVAVDHWAAVVGSRDIDLVLSACDRALENGRHITVMNEGLTPTLVYRNTRYTGQPGGMLLEADSLSTLIELDGERGALLLKAREHNTEVVGENDKEIVERLHTKYGVSYEDIGAYLLLRQMTNYFLPDANKDRDLHEYVRTNVIERYSEMLGTEIFSLSIDDAFALIHSSLDTAGVNWRSESAVIDHFLGQSTIRPVIDQLQRGEVSLNEIQKVTLLYNMLRDQRIADLMLKGWGDRATPDKLTVLGISHVDAVIEEAERRGLISRGQYVKYEETVRNLGRAVFQWKPILEVAGVS